MCFVRGFEDLYGDRLAHLILYGSQARGDARPWSDIDVLVVLKGDVAPSKEIDRTSDILSELFFEYEELVSCVYMEEEYFLKREPPLLRNIRREGIPI